MNSHPAIMSLTFHWSLGLEGSHPVAPQLTEEMSRASDGVLNRLLGTRRRASVLPLPSSVQAKKKKANMSIVR